MSTLNARTFSQNIDTSGLAASGDSIAGKPIRGGAFQTTVEVWPGITDIVYAIECSDDRVHWNLCRDRIDPTTNLLGLSNHARHEIAERARFYRVLVVRGAGIPSKPVGVLWTVHREDA